MPTDARICGLMLSYFKAEMTLKCLQTLINQGIEQMILVDNSADPEENLRTLALKQHFPADWLNIITAPENLGFARGMNLAQKQAQQLANWDYLLILNNDITASPQLVSRLRSFMDKHPDTVLLGATSQVKHENGEGLYYQRLTGLMFKRAVRGSFRIAAGYCLMVRASELRAHLFNQRYFMYGEDVELTWRLLQQKQTIHILPEPLLTHTPAQSSREGSLFYEYHINRGHWLLVKDIARHPSEKILMYTLRIPLMLTRAILRSWRFRSITPLKALALAGMDLSIRVPTHH